MWEILMIMWKIMLRTGDNFAHAKTAELSWHVQNYHLNGLIELKLKLKVFSRDFAYELIDRLCDGIQALSNSASAAWAIVVLGYYA